MKNWERKYIRLIFFTFAAIVMLSGLQTIVFAKPSKDLLTIKVEGKVYGTYPLDKDQTIYIGETNACRIENRIVTMVEAECPDKLCVLHRPHKSLKKGSLVCLPYQIILEIEQR